jgi:nucleoside-diphosphate-sugar epimerase
MKKSISILGSGWLGLPLAMQLHKQFSRVNISTRSAEKSNQFGAMGLTPFIIDIENLTDNIQPFLQSDILIVNITGKNIAAFNNLIHEIESSPIKKVLFTSSTGVYPQKKGLCYESDDLTHVDHPLLTIENLFLSNKYFKSTILRCAGLIGGKRHPGRFFTSGRAIRDAQAAVNLIHLDDCIAIISSIISKNIFPEILNVCADTHPSKEAFYLFNATAIGLPKPDIAKEPSVVSKIVANDKLKTLLSYQFIHADLMKIDPIKDYDL